MLAQTAGVHVRGITRPRLATVLLCIALVPAGIFLAMPADHIERIEILDETYVTIHFNTRPNRAYALQYRTVMNATNTTGWTNLFVAPSIPFDNHYVVADYRTNRQRFYRLRVTQ